LLIDAYPPAGGQPTIQAAKIVKFVYYLQNLPLLF